MTKTITYGVASFLILLGLFLPFGKESRTVVERVSEPLQGLNSPDLQIGGVRVSSVFTTSLNQATSSVLCSLQSPAATSSLMYASASVTTSTSSATFLSLNRSVNQFSTTTTALSLAQIPSGTSGFVSMASNTPFAPNTYLLVAQTGGGRLNQSGECQALFVPMF